MMAIIIRKFLLVYRSPMHMRWDFPKLFTSLILYFIAFGFTRAIAVSEAISGYIVDPVCDFAEHTNTFWAKQLAQILGEKLSSKLSQFL